MLPTSCAARRRLAYLLLGFLTIPLGLVVRFVPFGLPVFIVKYGGSTLWAVMVYWTVGVMWPLRKPISLASVAGAIATLMELQRLWHFPALDAFRVSLPGVLLLGRFFSVWDIVAYWLAICGAAIADGWFLRRWMGSGQA